MYNNYKYNLICFKVQNLEILNLICNPQIRCLHTGIKLLLLLINKKILYLPLTFILVAREFIVDFINKAWISEDVLKILSGIDEWNVNSFGISTRRVIGSAKNQFFESGYRPDQFPEVTAACHIDRDGLYRGDSSDEPAKASEALAWYELYCN